MLDPSGGNDLQRLDRNRPPLVAPLASSERGRAAKPFLLVRSLQPSQAQSEEACCRARAGDLRLSPADRLGPAARRRRDRLRTLDRVEGASSGGDLAPAEGGA